MQKRLFILGLLLPLALLSSCWNESTKPSAVDLAAFYAPDSTYYFEAPELFERIVNEPERMVLQYENASNPDYSNMLIITRKLAYPDSVYLDFVEEEVAARNAKGEFQLELVGRNDSVFHFRFSKGPADIDDWYMYKKAQRYCYSIYYSGERIGKEEAERLLSSIVEQAYTQPKSYQTQVGRRLYPELGLEAKEEYKLVKCLLMPEFVLDQNLSDKHFFEVYTSPVASSSACLIGVNVFEIKGDIMAYFEDFIRQQKEKRRCQISTYQGNLALEFTCYLPEQLQGKYGKTLCFVHQNRFYQITIRSAQEECTAACYQDFIGSLKLV